VQKAAADKCNRRTLGIGADGAKASSRNEDMGGTNEASATTAPLRYAVLDGFERLGCSECPCDEQYS
jgi:hypothetical protein